jgi:putative CocE/NonD family hydrolase
MVDWFRHWMPRSTDVRRRKDTVGPVQTADYGAGPPVRIFVMGENRWRDEPGWPLARARATPFYLQSAGSANTLNGDGSLTLEAPIAATPPDTFTYDPANPVPTGAAGAYSRAPTDQRAVEQRSDVLVYTSAPLQQPIEVTGPVRLVLWASSSARDTDFTARLVDVLPDGTARALTDGIQRARYRTSRTTPRLITPGQAEEYVIAVGATSNVFLAGHRIRLEVSSSNFPRFDRNPNTGAEFGTTAELLTARQTMYHDAERPSRLILPVIPR